MEARESAEMAFSHWRSPSAGEAKVDPVESSERRVYLIDRPGAPQSEVRLALLAPPRSSTDYYALQVLNNVLGGGFSSRLNLNLRENKGYSYGAFSALRYGRFQSLLLGIAPVESRVTKEAIDEMVSEFEAIGSWRRPVTEQELDDAKATLVRGYAQRFETMAQVVSEIVGIEGFELTLEELTRYVPGIQEVSMSQVEEVARKVLRTEELVLVVVGDGAQVEPAVRSLDLGQLIQVDSDGKPA
jgi:zinc protease